MERMHMESKNNFSENIMKISAIFPNCISESIDKDGSVKKVVNFDSLRQMLSEDIVEGSESFEFTWVGKKASIVEANKPIRKTLRPCKDESVNWDNTENLYIEGDNLEALKLLQESYLNKIKMIYIDPPYNTGSDFIYADNFRMSEIEYSIESGEIDETGNRMFQNSTSNGRYHSDWCSMIYSRLLVSRNLLADDGVIFISIDDNELFNLKQICDEIFGESNFVANLVWQSTAGSNTGTDIVTVTENVLVYTKNRSTFTFDGMIASDKSYSLVDEYVTTRGKYALDKLDRRRVGSHYSDALNYPITMPDGSLRYPGGTTEKTNEGWNYLWSKSKVQWGLENGFIEFKQTNGQWNVYNKRYAKIDNEGNPVERTIPFRNLITSEQFNTAQGTAELRDLFDIRPFDFPKPSSFVKHLMLTAIRKDKDAIVLDFFSGSASTAQALMTLNAEDNGSRKFILVQIPEEISSDSEASKSGFKTICDVGKDRIRRSGEKLVGENPIQYAGLDIGFRVFKIDDSNMNDIYYSAEAYSQDLLAMMQSNIKSDRTDLDLFFGCLLDWGLPLSLPYTSETIEGNTIHIYNGGDLIACFDEGVDETVVKDIARRKPLRVVFRDDSFKDSSAKINVSEIFKLISPDTRIKVL